MEHAKWNLDLFGVQSIRITQISFISNQTQRGNHTKNFEEENKKRLLVLSHQICHFGTPCFYFDKSPDYSLYFPDLKEKSAIIVYDYYSNFDEFELPIWIERSDFVINLSTHKLHKDFLDHFQLSLVLYYYYFYRKQNPYYFTSFLIFPYTEYFSDPFAFRPIPILRRNQISVRIITADLNSTIVDPPFPLDLHSYVFIEPYSHPFFVEKIEKKIELLDDDESSDSENDQSFIFFNDQKNTANNYSDIINTIENSNDDLFNPISYLPQRKNNTNFNRTTNVNFYATLRNIDQTIIKRKISKDLHYVLLTKPSLYLTKLKPAPVEENNNKGKSDSLRNQFQNNPTPQNWSNNTISLTNSQTQFQPQNQTPIQIQEHQPIQNMAPSLQFFNFKPSEFFTFDDQSFKNFFEHRHNSSKDGGNDIDDIEGDNFNEYEYGDLDSDEKMKQTSKRPQNSRIDFFDSKDDYFEYPEVTFFSIISEEISDKKVRKELTKTFSRIEEFPNKEIDLILPAVSFMSFFQFEIPMSKSEPPKHTRCFTKFTDVPIAYLSHTTVRVNGNGNVRDVNPTSIFEDWKNCHYLPISGKKLTNFVVFIVDFHDKNRVIDFFDALQSSFALLELGVLKPYSKGEDAFIETTSSDFFKTTNRFFETNKKFAKPQTISEFQLNPIITFVVSPNYFDQTLTSHSICSYLSIEQVKKMKQSDIDYIAFTVYSKIRIFHPYPFGVINIAPPVPASLFFGYRYQHPFHLTRKPLHPGLSLHIAWDPISKIASWVDDIGTVSHNFPNQSVQTLCSLIIEIIQFLKDISVDITFSILSESPPDELVNQVISMFGCYIQSFSIFSIIPTPQIQIVVNTRIEDDIIIFEDIEYTMPPTFIPAIPKCSCYVTSTNHPTYRISHHYNSKGEDDKSCLHEFAKNMSQLSWLSADPRTNRRLFSFPPHVASLLRKVRVKTKIATGFEFLP